MLAWTTAGRPWLDQNWGAQLLLYGVWRLGGFPLVAVVNALLGYLGLVAAACRRRTANLRLIAGATLTGYAAAAATFSARPQMFSLLLFGALLYLLEVARTSPRAALGIPLLMPFWANLHGAFIVGIGLLAIEVAAAACAGPTSRGSLRAGHGGQCRRAAGQPVGGGSGRLCSRSRPTGWCPG